jgi:ABC-type multidrug transport system fused ATPase/permease subunit
MDNLNPHKLPHSPAHVEDVMKECGLDSLIAAKGGFTAYIEAC